MAIFSYVVARDFGFAPNPFFGYCTLACCKPDVRRFAHVGDWIVGTGSAAFGFTGYLIYAMQVTEAMTFNEYWLDSRFLCKRPDTLGSRRIAYGDNIYRKIGGVWLQADSHHSYENGVQNVRNIENDTRVDRVLISNNFKYWGDSPLEIPSIFRNFKGHDICIGRGYKHHFPDGMEEAFVKWVSSLSGIGYIGRPSSWPRI